MAECYGCGIEIAGAYCIACSPDVDPASFDAIEGSATWPQAATHRVRSRRAMLAWGIAAAAALGLGLLWPSYSDAVDAGDASGRPFMIVGVIFVAAFVLLGTYFAVRKLRHHAAVVLGGSKSTYRNSNGRNTTHRYLHVQTRTGPLQLGTEHDYSLRTPGDRVIVFVRGSTLEDLWPVTDR